MGNQSYGYMLAGQLAHTYTALGAKMFGLSDFWLETRVIIKISTHP
jgi:hypothetical protein